MRFNFFRNPIVIGTIITLLGLSILSSSVQAAFFSRDKSNWHWLNPDRAPQVLTRSASDITSTSAVLNGSVDNNNTITVSWFEYGTDRELGNGVGVWVVRRFGSAIKERSFRLGNLTPNTQYFFRMVAINLAGISYGDVLSFRTAVSDIVSIPVSSVPLVATESAGDITRTSALLRASINPQARETKVWFEFGRDIRLLEQTAQVSVGAGNFFIAFQQSLTNLVPNSVYYYRIVARNDIGTTRGSILSFTTLP